MTPDEASAIIDAASDDVIDAVGEMFDAYRAKVLSGMAPREAVKEAMAEAAPEIAKPMADAFSAILVKSVSVPSVLAMKVGEITLSATLYSASVELSAIVGGLVDKHLAGFADAKALALDLFEGYGFKPVEVLKFSKASDILPKYLKEALLPDLKGQFEAAFARLTVADLSTPELKAAYSDVLKALEEIKEGAGADLLDRRLRVAFYEKARYIATRIAQTELHRAFVLRQAKELMDDAWVDWVQWRLSASHPVEDICDYFAEVDRYGLGPGVAPKAESPAPLAHPFCRCVLAPRLDLMGKTAKRRDGAELEVFAGKGEREARRIAGSEDKLERILEGADPLAVHNERIPDAYKVVTVAEAAEKYKDLP